MSILKIARMGHPILRARARALERREIKSPSIQQLIDDMIATMVEYEGAGLAAPQVHLDIRLFVAVGRIDDGHDADPIVLVNPEVSLIETEIVEDWEGCLSIPDIHGLVPRAREVSVRALNRKGERIAFRSRNFPARVIQHEFDHLEGVLFFDRMRSLESLTFTTSAPSRARAF